MVLQRRSQESVGCECIEMQRLVEKGMAAEDTDRQGVCFHRIDGTHHRHRTTPRSDGCIGRNQRKNSAVLDSRAIAFIPPPLAGGGRC